MLLGSEVLYFAAYFIAVLLCCCVGVLTIKASALDC